MTLHIINQSSYSRPRHGIKSKLIDFQWLALFASLFLATFWRLSGVFAG